MSRHQSQYGGDSDLGAFVFFIGMGLILCAVVLDAIRYFCK